MSEGVNFVTVAPRDKNKQYIKGVPWTLAPTSQFVKIASVVKDGDKKVSDIIFRADYKNAKLNDITLLLGKPFMMNVEVKKVEKDGNEYVNTKLKSPVPLMKGMTPSEPLIQAVSVNFEDEDLLEDREDLGGVSKFDLIRLSDLRKIVLANDYAGSKMQAAVQERMDEDELISKSKEIEAKIIETDRDLVEIRSMFPNGKPVDGEAPVAAKPSKPEKPSTNFDDMDDAPFK
jgi:hypothetical protein